MTMYLAILLLSVCDLNLLLNTSIKVRINFTIAINKEPNANVPM